MKAITYYTYGSPDVLKLEDIPRPVPKDDQVLVKVHAVSINSWDWDTLTGTPWEYRLFSGLFKPGHQTIHGCDIAGTVEATGRNAVRFKAGDAVFGDLSENGWGAFAEHACAAEDALVLKPSRMTFEEAACLSHAGNLAVQGLVDYGHIRSGQKVLVNGGGGGTGTLAIQLARTFDVEITGVDRTEKLDAMRALGADQVIDFTKEDFTRNGRQYDLIFDVKTTRSVRDYRRALSPGGAYVTVGGRTSRVLQVVVHGKLSGTQGMHMVVYKANKDSQYLVELFESGRLRPVIDRRFPLEETAEAFRYFGEGRFKGKVVVTMDHGNT